MRALILFPMLVLAGCSEESKPADQAEAPAAEYIKAGQWEMTTEVQKVTQRDKAAPAIKMPEGSKSTTSNCVAEADVKRPQPALFVPEGFSCQYRDLYMRGGRFNATLGCTRAGLSGDISIVVNGSYTADGIEATSTTETRLSGEGDERIDAKLTGRRGGACTAAPAKS